MSLSKYFHAKLPTPSLSEKPHQPSGATDNKFVLAKMCAFIAQKALKVTSESINFAKFAGGACP